MDITDGAFLTYKAFLSKPRIKTNFLSYHGVLAALRRYKETFSPHLNKTEKRVEEPKPSDPFTQLRFAPFPPPHPPPPHPLSTRSQIKWFTKYPLLDSFPVNWKKTYTHCFFMYAGRKQNLGFFNSSFSNGESQSHNTSEHPRNSQEHPRTPKTSKDSQLFIRLILRFPSISRMLRNIFEAFKNRERTII